MKKLTMNRLVPLCAISILAALSTPASATIISVAAGSLTQCAATGSAGTCAAVYQFNSDGSVDTLVDSSVPSTDGIEDTLIGVQNNSGHILDSLTLNGAGLGIFGFEGDGGSAIANPGTGAGDTYFGKYFDGKNNLLGTTSFSGINGATDVGTIDFAGLVSGGYGWFVLEEQIDFSAPPNVSSVPLPAALPLMASALGFGGLARRRKMQKDAAK